MKKFYVTLEVRLLVLAEDEQQARVRAPLAVTAGVQEAEQILDSLEGCDLRGLSVVACTEETE